MVTMPARMQDVQTLRRLTVPLTSARILWMFGFHQRLVRRWEWLTFMPVDGRLPQISHIADIAHLARACLARACLVMAHAGGSGRVDVSSGCRPAGPPALYACTRGRQRNNGVHRPPTRLASLLMGPLETLSANDLRSVMLSYRDALRSHQETINRLNVYPVPDGDTGTNMALTVEAVVNELASASGDPAGATLQDGPRGAGSPDGDGDPSTATSTAPAPATAPAGDGRRAPDEDLDLAGVCRAISHGSLMGARGNSGVILSQVFRAISGCFAGSGPAIGAGDLAVALRAASDAAWDAVMRPVEGTVLTVARAAGEAACLAAESGASLIDVIDAARSAASDTLARTPEMLPVLAKAGVVDAGGAGYLLLFDALGAVVDGRALPEPAPGGPNGSAAALDRAPATGATTAGAGSQRDRDADPARIRAVDALRYEVMYLLDARDDLIPAFKEVWAGIGDSIVVVGGDGLWNCHVHTDDIGAAIEAAIDVGRPREIRVTDLSEQVDEVSWVREGSTAGAVEEDESQGPPPVTSVVAVATGDGVRRIFRSLGARRVVAGGQSMNPSTAQILEAVEAVPASSVIILPNNDNILAVAAEVHALTRKEVRVVATSSVAEGFAALLEYDPQAEVDVNAAAMEQAAGRVVSGEVTRAVRASETPAGHVDAGDWLGLSRAGLAVVRRSLLDASVDLLARLVTSDHEIVTIIEGEGSGAGDTRRITEWLNEAFPSISVEVHHGGQPLYPYLFSIE